MAEISFDDVPFEKDTEASSADISFDDVPLEEKAPPPPRQSAPQPAPEAIPVNPMGDVMPGAMPEQAPRPTRIGDKVPISAREPDKGYNVFANEPFLDTLKRRGQQVAQGLGEFAASAAEGAALPSRMLLTPEERKKQRVEDTAGFQTAAGIRSFVEKYIGEPDERDTSFWGQVAQGAGSLGGTVGVSLAATSAGGPLIGIGAGAATSAAATSAQMYKEALASGATEEEALLAAQFGIVIGTSEVIPVARAFKMLPAPFREAVTDAFYKKALEVAQSGGEEALQEWSTQVAQNLVAQNIYDPDRGWSEGATEAALVGAVLGTGMGTVAATTTGPEKVSEKGPAADESAALNQPKVVPNPTLKGKLTKLAGDLAGQEVEILGETPDGLAYRVRYPDGRESVAGRRAVEIIPTQNVAPDVAEALRPQQPAQEPAPQPTPPAPPAGPPVPPPPPPVGPNAGPTQGPTAQPITQPPVAPPAGPPPVGPNVGPTQAPPAPATQSQGDRIREIARARQQAKVDTAPPVPPTPPGTAAEPQDGGAPAAPTTSPETTPPVTSEGKPPVGPAAGPTQAPARMRNFSTESSADILHAAGLKTGEIAAMKKGDQARVTSLIRSAMRSQYSADELNTMSREEYNAKAREIYEEIKAATAPAPKPAPVSPEAREPVTAPSKPAPVSPEAREPVTAPSKPVEPTPEVEAKPEVKPETAPQVAEEKPLPPLKTPEVKITKGSEVSAEERQRLIDELNKKMKRGQPEPAAEAPAPSKMEAQVQKMADDEQRAVLEEAAAPPEVKPVKAPDVTSDEVVVGERKAPPSKAEKIVEVSQQRTGRVLEDVSAEGRRKQAEALLKGRKVAQDMEAETARAEERRQKAEQGPAGAKMNPVEVARRQANKTASTEIVKEFAPDNKLERDFDARTYEGDKARQAIWSRARRIIAAAEKRLAADEGGVKIPKNRKTSAKEEQGLSAEMLLLMEARDLAKLDRPTPAAVIRFKNSEALLRAGDVDTYMANRRGDVDTANRRTPDVKNEEGETLDVAQALRDTRATPEEAVIEKLDEDTEAEAPVEEKQDRPAVASEKNLGAYVTIGAKKTPVVVTRAGKIDRSKFLKEREKVLAAKITPAERAKATSELRELEKSTPEPEFSAKTIIGSRAPNAPSAGKRRTVEEVSREIEELGRELVRLYEESAKTGQIDWDALDRVSKKRGDLIGEKTALVERSRTIKNKLNSPAYALFIKQLMGLNKFYMSPYATDFGFFDEMVDRITEDNLGFVEMANEWGPHYGELQGKLAPEIINLLKEKIGGVPVFVVPDAVMNKVQQAPSAFYDYHEDAIVIRESHYNSPSRFVWDMIHEGAHAAFYYAIRSNPELRRQLEVIRKAALDHSKKMAYPNFDQYGFSNVDEFVSELVSNPYFAERLAVAPLSREDFQKAGISPPSKRTLKSALQYFRELVVKTLGIDKLFEKLGISSPTTAMDYAVSIVDRLFDMSVETRDLAFNRTSKENRIALRDTLEQGYLQYVKATVPKPWEQKKTGGQSTPNIIGNVKDSAPLSPFNQLMAGGVPLNTAREINNYLKQEMGKTIDPATLPLLIADYIAEYGQKKVTPAGNVAQPKQAAAGSGAQPPYKAPPTPGMGPGKPLKPQPTPSRGAEGKWAKRMRKIALKNMSLDFIRQKYRNDFYDSKGNIVDDLIVNVQRTDTLAAEFAKPINEATAEYTDLMRTNAKEAVELADLAMEATRLNVRLGPNADNSHLGKNAAMGLQGKRRLADLNRRFSAMSQQARDVYKKLTTVYRDAHNHNVEALAYNILSQLEPKLSNSDLMNLMNRTVNGQLDASDAATVNDKIIFNALRSAQELKVIKGDYFPQMRFGNYVVVTSDALTNPGWTSVPMKMGKNKTVSAPVKTELDGNALRVIVDPTIRGAQTAASRALREYVANSDLTLLGMSTRYRDRQTGAIVSKGDQMIGRTYDTVYEARFQTKGVHYFETLSDADNFRKNAKNTKVGDVLTREEFGQTDLVSGSTLAAVVNRIHSSEKLSDGEKKLFDNFVKNAIISSMDGNSARTRYQARRNVQGASRDIARAAVTYGQAAGHFHASLYTSPQIRDAMQRLHKFQQQTSTEPGGGLISDVTQELHDRMATIEGANEPWRWLQTVATISFIDKLMSLSYSMVNGLQVMGTTMPVLAGRYGAGKANVAIANAYRKIGAFGATMSGLKGTANAVWNIRRTAINTDDIIGSIRQKLGPEYYALVDKLLEQGAVAPDAGQEVAAAVENSRGMISTAIGRLDRVARQLPNAVEAVNRLVTAVATYDLAMAARKKEITPDGKEKMVPVYTKQEAIQQAFDTVMNTQGDYRKKNSPVWMQHPAASWSLQFKKYAHLMYQLTVDMYARALKGANKQERKIARKQLVSLYMTQAALAGVFGVSGLEILKVGAMALSVLGFAPWDELEDEWRKDIAEATNPTIGSILSNGLLSEVTMLDFSTRLNQADMALGYLPAETGRDDFFTFFGKVALGAPGATLIDWTQAAKAYARGDWEQGIALSMPIKQFTDVFDAARGVADNKLTPYEAGAKAVGIRSLDTAKESRKKSANIRSYGLRKARERVLRNDLIRALDRRSPEKQRAALKAILEYNLELKKLEKETGQSYRPLNPKSIVKYYLLDKKNIYGDE